MTLQQHQITILAVIACLVALLIPALVYQQLQFAPKLKATERAVAEFKPTALQVPSSAWQPVSLRLPVTPQQPQAVPAMAGAAATPALAIPSAPPLQAPTVSFILSDGGKDMAIINGAVLKVGDRYQDWQVTRIERTRVLLTGRKGPLWLTLQ
ncbi:hypothetical protein [Trichlorobacter sp.]|jgi:hypothetical protein|uniref:hypothetical protein n=1 Tax=Trichlorobacter sp. TaxID=2911007 RepID=UPI002A3605D5|nr:hypothetical protein [Trichlorobacter sp.]MDY0385305.1 hypothetical protein [Trichlorobacter sp.]